jgi:O-antigen/teichoic acid export membrane protein
MKRKQLFNLSANALQLILNQLFGLVIFYILSTTLGKSSFGQVNLALAILLAAFNILSFGIDQLVIKKIAAGNNQQLTLSLYISHTLITGLLFYGVLLAGIALFPNHPAIYNLVLLIGIGKLMIYFSTPFKQAANGLELFKLLALLSIISNFIRCVCLIVFALLHSVNLQAIVAIFIIGDTLEFLIGLYLFKKMAGLPLTFKWDRSAYLLLLREALPQGGVVIITSALARFDWIFIGFMLSAAKLAEYSFAYKVFEVSTLPLLAIAPLLIPHFTKLFQQSAINIENFKFLVRMEMVVAALIGLLLNLCWAPVIDGITAGKYGAVNITTIFILTLCMPFLYLNNFLWTIYFAQGRLKMILTAFIITLIVNVAGDVILIPIYKNEGAAFAFLLGCIAQAVFFMTKNKINGLGTIWQPLVICVSCALCSGFAVKHFFADGLLADNLAIVLYFVLLFITAQLRLKDTARLKAVF